MARTGTPRGPLSFFRNLKTAQKLLVGFLITCVLMIGVGGIGISKLAAAQASLDGMYHDSTKAISQLSTVDTTFNLIRGQIVNYALTPDPAEMDAIEAAITANWALVDEKWTLYTGTDMRGREVARDAFIVDVAAYRKVVDEQLMPLAKDNDLAEFLAVRNELVSPIVVRVEKDLTDLLAIEDVAAEQALTDSAADYASARTMIITFILVALAVSIALAVGIGRMIAGPMAKAVVVLEGLAEGRLDLRLEVDTRDEVGQMASALNRAMV
ncbi:MCP four helix bundle domain-containing protein, partial [Pengzhenrongella frigida]